MSTSGAATGWFSNWSATADREDARNVVVDQTTVAALQMYAPQMAFLYLHDDLPDRVERLLDRATAYANAVAGAPDSASYVEAYRDALGRLLANAFHRG
jgi:hypothetical protein